MPELRDPEQSLPNSLIPFSLLESGGGGGTRGALWFVGSGPPTDLEDTLPGDQYLDQETGDIYTLTPEPAGIAAAVMADDPSSYWPLANGDVTDVAGTRTLTNVGGGAADGLNWDATDYSGSGQYGSSTAGDLQLASDFTVECWVLRNTGTGLVSVLTVSDTGNPCAFGFDTHLNRWRTFITGNGGATNFLVAHDPDALVPEEWVHLVATYQAAGNELTLYKNGESVASASITTGVQDEGALQMWLARYNASTTQYLPGRLAHVAVYDEVLTEARILAHYEAGLEPA